MLSKSNILQNVVKTLREVLRQTDINMHLRGISFENQHSQSAPVRLRCRVQNDGKKQKAQVGESLTKELWRLGETNNFIQKLRCFLSILQRVKPNIFQNLTKSQYMNSLEKAELLAQGMMSQNMGAYFLFKKF